MCKVRGIIGESGPVAKDARWFFFFDLFFFDLASRLWHDPYMPNQALPQVNDAPTFAAGNCRTCGRPKGAPYRRHVGGEVTEGCIAADHDEHADAWHLRPRAVAHRADTAAHLARVLGR